MPAFPLLLTLALGGMGKAVEAPEPASASASVCFQPEIPPRGYFLRDRAGQKTAILTGASVDVLRTALSRIGLNVDFRVDLPWKRCLALVEAGSVDFAMDAYFDTERARRFLYSQPYWRLTPQVYFLAKAPLAINGAADLKRYRGCGMGGWSYQHYGLATADIDVGSFDFQALFKKLKAGRCQYVVEELEVVEGLKTLGDDFLADKDLAHGPVHGAVGPATYLIACKDARHVALMNKLNEQLAAMTQSGETMQIWKKYSQLSMPRP